VSGESILGGLVGDLAIPKQTGGATGYWLAEGDTATESTPAVGQVPLNPKSVGAYPELTRKLLKQSSIDVETFVRTELASTLALLIDKAGLHGAGGNEPTGIANTSGIGSVVGGATGAAPTWANIVDLETQVAIDNADIGSLAYVSNAKVRGKLKTTLVNATAGSDMIWPLNSNQVNGYPVYVTNQVRSDLTKSTGTNLSAIFFGNWADLIVGMWGGLDILVNPYAKDTSGTVRVTALQAVDVAIRHAESFAAMLDAATA
jgi:HK97 family phage major capsid protein